ncbi:33215_t:CDS:2, partial [Gigaspora margarita]
TIATLLEPIAQVICLLSTASYLTMGNLHTTFPVILDLLDDALVDNNDNDILSKKQIIQKMHTKFLDYWIKLKKQYYLSVIFDPNLKLFSFATDDISNAQTNTSSSNFEVSNNPSRSYFKKHLKYTLTIENSEHERNIFDEYLFSAEED